TLVGAAVVQAKRLAPKTGAPPVVQGQTRYVVDYSGMTVPASNRGAYLRAVDVSSGSQLGRRMIYRVVYDEGLEADVQELFVPKLGIGDGRATIENELGERFEMILETGSVAALAKRSPRTEVSSGLAQRP